MVSPASYTVRAYMCGRNAENNAAAPFQWAAIFHKEDINFTHGHHDLQWYDPTEKTVEHKLPCKVRCSFCHSPIMDEGRNMILLFPSLINLDTQQAKDNFKPRYAPALHHTSDTWYCVGAGGSFADCCPRRCHIFYSQRVMDIPDGIPKWTKIDKTSELIEDSPPEMVQEMERKRKKGMDSQIQNREVGDK